MKIEKAIEKFHNHYENFIEPIEGVKPIIYNYDKSKPNLIYCGQGITNDLHIGHQIVLDKIKILQKLLGAKIFFMYASDEKYLEGHITKPEIVNRVKNYYKKNLDNIEFYDTIENIDSFNYIIILELVKQMKLTKIKHALGSNNIVKHIYYTPVQCFPIYKFIKEYNIFVVTAEDQMPYFSMIHDILKRNKLPFANYFIVESCFNTLMNSKMSSRDTNNTIFLNESAKSLYTKILKSKSYGNVPTKETLKQDFCYNISLMLNFEKVYSSNLLKKYVDQKISSKEYKLEVYNFFIKYLKSINY
jgi:tryptophanyl-tRNA synthetase